jgi:intracellular multiplication protein IcmE
MLNKIPGVKKGLNFLACHPRLRIVVIIVTVLVLFIIGVNVFTGGASTIAVPQSNVQTNQNAEFNHTRKVGEADYNKLATENNNDQRSEATLQGKTYLHGLFQNGKPVEKHTVKSESPQAFYKHTDHAFFHVPTSKKARKAQSMPTESVGNLSGQMNSQLQKLSSGWNTPKQTTVVGSLPQEAPSTSTAPDSTVMLKAGKILFAVLDTALNSDQAGTPVLATIVQGKYRGAKLLGSFVRENERLVVKFSTMTLKTMDHSLAVNAYAIDSKTAQNAMASSVNHHYLLRYGSLFAASFLDGFGSAYAAMNHPPPCLLGGCTYPALKITTKNAAFEGIGKAGQSISQEVAQNFDTPPTVKLKQGIGMGILFMTDVTPTDNAAPATAENPMTQPGQAQKVQGQMQQGQGGYQNRNAYQNRNRAPYQNNYSGGIGGYNASNYLRNQYYYG